MKTQLKEMLEGCRIEAKWLSCGTWTKEIFTNLLEFCEMRSLKITKKGNSYNLKLKIGNYTLQKKQIYFCDLERSIYEFVYIYMFTLGDKSKLKTRFKQHSICRIYR